MKYTTLPQNTWNTPSAILTAPELETKVRNKAACGYSVKNTIHSF